MALEEEYPWIEYFNLAGESTRVTYVIEKFQFTHRVPSFSFRSYSIAVMLKLSASWHHLVSESTESSKSLAILQVWSWTWVYLEV